MIREGYSRVSTTVFVASQKGGSGKTSCTLNLGALAVADGKTLLVDCDPQGSLAYWRDRRDAAKPDVISTSLASLEQEIATARTQDYQYVFVDTPPHNYTELATAMRFADMIVVPVRPTALDLHAAEATLKLAARIAKRTLVVLTQCQAPRLFMEAPSVRQARAVFDTLGCRVAEQAIVHRGTVEQSVALGKSVGEYEPDGTSAHEFKNVWLQVRRELGSTKK